MVGLIIVGIALAAFLVVVAVAYMWPGPDQGKPATSSDARENLNRRPRKGIEWPMGP